ncbi:cocaine- and amphetamine-regulated transcript-like [Clupea harengus]|uniref:Cocaine- and amphetamine-regulated transcript-like n=1 Tax=Clupea harengus TaxID=7950 RepID=A0A6P8FGL6_CLUHA|nr:cocaine- and amphetamine-regulated transcript-like [Clupea harengus]XP_031424910.1 cocaine- and amphetamine-regulated transcript-like [Clupea harengus]XP_042563959.1 cocaine- and amphetamine-regulated transcript-like [Clupea harengus]
MDSAGMLFGLLCISFLSVICNGQVSKEVSTEDVGPQNSVVSADRDLLQAMDVLLGRYNEQLPSSEKRGIPMCGMGSRCAMRYGPRFGTLCDCGRGSNCNSYILKCI